MKHLLLLFRGGRPWQEDAKLVIPRTQPVGIFLVAGIVLWFATIMTAHHHVLSGLIHVLLVLAFACFLVALTGRGKGLGGDVRQLRALFSVFRLRSSTPWWQRVALRMGCIVLGVRRKDG